MKKRFGINAKKMLSSVILISVAFLIVASPLASAYVDVSASKEDTYTKLLKAADVNVVMNTLRKCMGSVSSLGIAGKQATAGTIFSGSTNITTSRWVEDYVQGGNTFGWGDNDGQIWCTESKNGKNILTLATETLNVPIEQILCNDGKHGIIARAKVENTGYNGAQSYTQTDSNCSSFNDTGAEYVKASDASDQLKNFYNNWLESNKSDNSYYPTWDNLGNFNNTDGYFTYLRDFNTGSACATDDPVTASNVKGSTDYYPITTFNISQDAQKLIATRKYYHLTNNGSWSKPLSDDNPVTSCSGLLQRINQLETKDNGAIAGSVGGYKDILVKSVNDSCSKAATKDGNNAWDELKKQLQGLIDNPDATSDDKDKATKNLQLANDVTSSGDYVQKTGNVDSDDGEVYQCVTVEGLTINTDKYNYSTSTNNSTDSGSEASCYDAGASLGWILCPLLDMTSHAANDIYNKVVEPFLKMDASLLDINGAGANTFKAWQLFQGIANVIFVILFLVVIFSQVTGIGIDNYGIKKILPKLIVAAVMMNLSYFICELAVDISNIIGSNIKGLFDSLLGQNFNITAVTYGGKPYPFSQALGTTAITAVTGILVAIVGVTAIFSNGFAILVPLLLGAISVLFAIFFVFVILSVRKAAVIVLVVVSPIAFLLYMLPNTKSIYDKWLKAFEGVLLLYPICGALVGGGNFVSKLLLSTGNGQEDFFFALSAVIIGIAPIFFIPTLLKQSFAAMGNIGAKISGVGKGLSGKINGRIRDSDSVKDFQLRHRAGMDANGNLTARGRWLDNKYNNSKSKLGKAVWGMSAHNMQRARISQFDQMQKAGALDKYSNSDYLDSRNAQIKAKQSAQDISDIESNVSLGQEFIPLTAKQIHDGVKIDKEHSPKVNANDVKTLGRGFEAALASNDTTRIKAYTNMLSKSDTGRDQLRKSTEAVANGTSDYSGIDKKAGEPNGMDTLANDIMENHTQEYKQNARSTWDFAKDRVQSASDPTKPAAQITDEKYASGGSPEKFTEETVANMDDAEFDRVNANYNAGNMTKSQAEAWQHVLNEAYDSKKTPLKGERRVAIENSDAASAPNLKFKPDPPKPTGPPPAP